MKQRNPNATCGNCPYWHERTRTCRNCFPNPDQEAGPVRMLSAWHRTMPDDWCGQHPKFWAEVAQAETPCPECAKRDAVIAQCSQAMENIYSRFRGGPGLDRYEELHQAISASRTLTPSPLYAHAAELLEAAEILVDGLKRHDWNGDQINNLKRAVDAAKGEMK